MYVSSEHLLILGALGMHMSNAHDPKGSEIAAIQYDQMIVQLEAHGYNQSQIEQIIAQSDMLYGDSHFAQLIETGFFTDHMVRQETVDYLRWLTNS